MQSNFLPVYSLIATSCVTCSYRIPPERQKLRSGFPPRELLPPADPTHPVNLTNGEKVSVEVLPAPSPVSQGSSTESKQEAGYGTRGDVAGQVKAAGAAGAAGATGATGGEGAGLLQAQQTQQGITKTHFQELHF